MLSIKGKVGKVRTKKPQTRSEMKLLLSQFLMHSSTMVSLRFLIFAQFWPRLSERQLLTKLFVEKTAHDSLSNILNECKDSRKW